jgi:hypothetical protein
MPSRADALRHRQFRTAIPDPTCGLMTTRSTDQGTMIKSLANHRTGIAEPPTGRRPQNLAAAQSQRESETGLLPAADHRPPPSGRKITPRASDDIHLIASLGSRGHPTEESPASKGRQSRDRTVTGIQASHRNRRTTRAAAVLSGRPNITLEPNLQAIALSSIPLGARGRGRHTLIEAITVPPSRGLIHRLTILTEAAKIPFMNDLTTIHDTHVNLHTTASIPGEGGAGTEGTSIRISQQL